MKPKVSAFCRRCGAWQGQLGLEPTPELYVEHMVEVFREVKRVLRDDGTLWMNMGDSYATGAGKVGECPGGGEQGERWKAGRGTHTAENSGRPRLAAMGPMTQPNRLPLPGLKPKDLVGIPWRLAFALQADGWWLRSDIIWAKPNPMPESVTDRPTKAHEYLFLLAKSGEAQFWMHRDLPGMRVSPKPDWRWVHKETGEEVAERPSNPKEWKRINLWRGHDYFYDADAAWRLVHDLAGLRKRRLTEDDLLQLFDQLQWADQLDESAAEMLRQTYV